MLNILNKNSKTTNKRMRDFLLKNTMQHIRKITNDYKNKNQYRTEDIINNIEYKMEDNIEDKIEDKIEDNMEDNMENNIEDNMEDNMEDKMEDINKLKNTIIILNKINNFLLFLSISSIVFILHNKNNYKTIMFSYK
jgi:vacuolar-type H+-ATPase subunit I/STV1